MNYRQVDAKAKQVGRERERRRSRRKPIRIEKGKSHDDFLRGCFHFPT